MRSVTAAGEQLHEASDDGLQQRMQFLVVGCTRFDEAGHAIGVGSVHRVQHPPVQMDVEVGGRVEAPDQGDSATVALPGRGQQVPRDHALHHLQHRRDQLTIRGPLAAERKQLVVAALAAAPPHAAVGEDAAFDEVVKLVVDEPGHFGAAAGRGVGDGAGGVLLHQAIQRDLLRATRPQAPPCRAAELLTSTWMRSTLRWICCVTRSWRPKRS